MDQEQTQIIRNAKIGLIFAILVMTLLTSFLPWVIGRRFKNALVILTIGMCFAGGVILGGALSHLMPDATKAWNSFFEQEDPDNAIADFPFAGLLAGFSLMSLIAIDKVVVSRGLSGEEAHNHMVIDLPDDYDEDAAPKNVKLEDQENPSKEKLEEGVNLEDQHEINSKPKEPMIQGHRKDNLAQRESEAQAWVFFVALSLHSIFDGLGIGASDNIQGFYGLLIAVLAHKLLDGFALGVPVYMAKFPLRKALFALIFCAAMTPFGIGIGMAATEGYKGSSGQLAKAIILSISGGSFFFISLIELIPSGLHKYGWQKTKILAVFIGWAIMTLIAIWV